MKITNIETLCLSRPHEPERQWWTKQRRTVKADCAIVVIDTDAGIRGVGEASAYGDPLRIRGKVAALAADLVGRDAADPELAPRPAGQLRADDIAAAGVDCALWDLRGKIAGRPVRALLSERPLDRVRLYASSGVRHRWDQEPEQQLIEEARGYLEAGYGAMKLRIGLDWQWYRVTPARYLQLARALSEAVGDRMELMLDGNCRLTEQQALEVGHGIGELGWTWLEEPVPRDPEVYARLSAALDIPVTGGEPFSRVEQFEPYLERSALAVVQPDAGVCGISEWWRIAQRAEQAGVDVVPHSWHNGLMAMANGQLVAALQRPRFLELCMVQGPLQWAVLADPPAIDQGHLVLPQAPGLGVELAAGLQGSFPFIEGSYDEPLAPPSQ